MTTYAYAYARSIQRTRAQFCYDLDVTYAFAGYRASHRTPPPPDVVVDLAIQRITPAQLAAFDALAYLPCDIRQTGVFQ